MIPKHRAKLMTPVHFLNISAFVTIKTPHRRMDHVIDQFQILLHPVNLNRQYPYLLSIICYGIFLAHTDKYRCAIAHQHLSFPTPLKTLEPVVFKKGLVFSIEKISQRTWCFLLKFFKRISQILQHVWTDLCDCKIFIIISCHESNNIQFAHCILYDFLTVFI